MDFKKKWQRFWTLQRHNDGGFTLVELVVVIAIMAILAGVGTTGYAGYIKSANKNSDRVLVGNVIRAIETGGNSAAFISDESRAFGKLSYPVGFVVLSTEGTQVLTSTATNSEVSGDCNFVTQEVQMLSGTTITKTCTAKSWGTTCGSSVSATVYVPAEKRTVTYCATHSGAPGDYMTDFSINHPTLFGNHSTTANGTVNGYADTSRLYGDTGNGSCELAKNPGLNGGEVVANSDSAIYNAVVAAYGSLDNLKLKYENWTSEEGSDYATFMAGADGVMSDMESMSSLLVLAGNLGLGGTLGLGGEYDSSAEVLSGVCGTVLNTHSNTAWTEQWGKIAETGTWDSTGFGLKGRENYSAARMAYNTGFATYLEAQGIDPKYAEAVQNFSAQSMNLPGVGNVFLPALICKDAFTDTDSPLSTQLAAVSNTDDDAEVFSKIQELYDQYAASDACSQNAEVFYNTMETFRDTEAMATDPNNAFGGDMLAYYNSYVNDMSSLYQKAQQSADGGIMITVSVVNGQMQFAVSPNAANPRNG